MRATRALELGGGAPMFPLAVLGGLQMLDQATQSAFNVLIPNVRNAFHLSDTKILLIVALAGACALLGTIPVAWLADRTVRVTIALAGAGAGAVFSVALGAAPTAVVMGVMLCGVYLGQAVIFPTHNSLIADYYPVEARQRVYSLHRAGLSLGAATGVLLGAGLTAAFNWRVPFIAFAIPIAALVVVGFRLREPARGSYEDIALSSVSSRSALKADVVAVREPSSLWATVGDSPLWASTGEESEAVVAPAEVSQMSATVPVEAPPSFGEAWRLVWKIRVLRRIFVALPFLAAAIAGFASLASLQYQQTFHLDVLHRAFLVAPVQVFVLGGLGVGAVVGTRLAARGMHLVFRMLAVTATVASALAALFAMAPSVPVAFFADAGIEACLAIVGPGVLAALSLAIPARARSVGFSIGALFVVPGLVVIPAIGGLGDAVGFRYGMLILVPVFLVGGLVVASAGSLIEDDIRDVWISMHTRREMLEARARGEMPLLSVRKLMVAYDGVTILEDVDFEIGEGEIVAIVGTNGAGKSTLLKALCGVAEAEAGVVVFDGRDVTHAPPDEIARMGVGLMPGGEGVFPTLTVEENLRAAAWHKGRSGLRSEDNVKRTLERFAMLGDRRFDRAGDLSGGQQQMLALAMALLAAPSLLLVDELSLGVAPVVVEQLLSLIRELREAGTSVVLVEQSVSVAISVADRVYVMDAGRVRFTGSASQLRDDPGLLWSIYLSRAATATAPAASAASAQGAPASDGPPRWALEASRVAVSFGGIRALDDVTLSVAPGEIVGVIGPNGAGKTTFFDVVSGFLRVSSGRVRIDGTDVSSMPPGRRSRLGLGRSFQDSRLFSSLSVRDTLAVALERFIEVGDPLNASLRMPAMVDTEAAVDERVEELIDLFGLGRFEHKFMNELSTGTRRLVDLAAVVAHAPTLILLDEPSSGVAQREVEALGELLLNVRAQLDATLVVVEHDIPFISDLAGRLVVLDRGSVLADGEPKEVLRRPEVVEAFMGGHVVAGGSGRLEGRPLVELQGAADPTGAER
jgi:ABC-type branched-subunit amino acid transport system ATPase component